MKKLILLLLLSAIAYAQPDGTGDFYVGYPKDPNGKLRYDTGHMVAGFTDSSFTIPLTLNQWAQVTNTGNNLYAVLDSSRITYSADTFACHDTNHKEISAVITFTGNNGEHYEFKLTTSAGTMHSMAQHVQTTANNEEAQVSVLGYWEPNASGDTCQLEMRNTTDNDDASAVSSQIHIVEIIHKL